MNITEDKLKAAIQITLGGNGIYTHELESELIHYIKALSIDSEQLFCYSCQAWTSHNHIN